MNKNKNKQTKNKKQKQKKNRCQKTNPFLITAINFNEILIAYTYKLIIVLTESHNFLRKKRKEIS